MGLLYTVASVLFHCILTTDDNNNNILFCQFHHQLQKLTRSTTMKLSNTVFRTEYGCLLSFSIFMIMQESEQQVTLKDVCHHHCIVFLF